eukprot:Em0019g791a
MNRFTWSLLWLHLIHEIGCSHFSGGTMSWKYNADRSAIQIVRRTFWRASLTQSCVGNDGTGSTTFTSVDCSDLCSQLNDSTRCTDSSTLLDWTTGERIISYTASSFHAWYSSCCWTDGGRWDLKVDVDKTKTNNNGTINTSPSALMFPIVRIQNNCNPMFTIPVVDVDHNLVMCRWGQASEQECGDVCMMLPFETLNISACTLNLIGIPNGLYTIALQIEDTPTTYSDRNLSSVPLQFRLELYSSPYSCDQLPQISNNITNGSICGLKSNTEWKYRITAQTSGPMILEIVTMSPFGLTKSSLNQGASSSQWYIDVSWTPDETQSGPHLFCFSAVDSERRMSKYKCLTLWIGADINECSLDGEHYSCQSGYTLVGFNCIDINECSSNGGLGPCQQICTNTNGSFNCSCHSGYTLSGLNCNDINECEMNDGIGPCSQVCINSAGSYNCSCHPCMNGLCINGSCSCVSTYSGGNCSQPLFSGCELNPCLNGGVCIQSGELRTCVCPSNTTGIYCENSINSCSLNEATALFLSNLITRRRHLGTSQSLPAKNCAEIKYIRSEVTTGVYWILSTNETSVLAFCQYL